LIRIQAMRTKWGSCSKRGTITLATDLANEEVGFQNFVIAHELPASLHPQSWTPLQGVHDRSRTQLAIPEDDRTTTLG